MVISLELIKMALMQVVSSPYVHIFFWIMVLDILTGYVKALKTRKFDSKTGTMGLLKHLLVFSSILLVGVYARALGFAWLSISWCSFHILNYAGSLIENWEVIDIAFPSWLKPYVNQMKKAASDRVVSTLKVETLEVKKEVDADGQHHQSNDF